jgi:hypothetical protein
MCELTSLPRSGPPVMFSGGSEGRFGDGAEEDGCAGVNCRQAGHLPKPLVLMLFG